jgi:hypothetical protein
VFKEVNTQYMKLTHTRKDTFLSEMDAKVWKDTNIKSFYMKIILLPHQILILPKNFQDAIDPVFLSRFKVFQDQEIRYLYRKHNLIIFFCITLII